jgi:hypothetical protein
MVSERILNKLLPTRAPPQFGPNQNITQCAHARSTDAAWGAFAYTGVAGYDDIAQIPSVAHRDTNILVQVP